MAAHMLYKMHSSIAIRSRVLNPITRAQMKVWQILEHLVGSFSFHQVALMASGACTLISCLLCFFLIFQHATHYAVPKEQKQIIRMIFIVPVFAVCALLSVAFLKSSIYIEPIETLYESFALSAFFLYLLCCIHEDEDEWHSFFESSGQMSGYRKTALMVFQFPVVEFLIFILTEITEATGTYCASSSKPCFASIWVTIICAVSTAAAVVSVLKFYKPLKTKIGARKPLNKLIGFKAIVGVTWIQNIIIKFLTSSSDLKPTSKLTYKDLTIAIPNLIVSFEMIIFALVFLKVMGVREYNIKKGASAVPL